MMANGKNMEAGLKNTEKEITRTVAPSLGHLIGLGQQILATNLNKCIRHMI